MSVAPPYFRGAWAAALSESLQLNSQVSFSLLGLPLRFTGLLVELGVFLREGSPAVSGTTPVTPFSGLLPLHTAASFFYSLPAYQA